MKDLFTLTRVFNKKKKAGFLQRYERWRLCRDGMGMVKRRVMRGLLDTRCDRRIDMHMYRHPYTDVGRKDFD